MRFIKKIIRNVEKYHYLAAALLILLVLFDFGYLSETGIWVNYYHHNFIIATINDLFQGKHLLVDTFNQYGLLYPFSLYVIFKTILSFSYMNLYLIFMIGTIIYYAILYGFLLAVTKKKIIAVVGLIVSMGIVMTFNFPTFPFSENYVWPGSIPLRYFFDGLVFLLLLKNKNFKSYNLHIITACLVAIAIFFNLETGISLGMGYLFLLFGHVIMQPIKSPLKKLHQFVHILIPFIISIGIIAFLFSLYTYSEVHAMPHWALFWHFPLLYGSGLSNAKTPIVGWYYINLCLYFSVLTLFIFRSIFLRQKISWKWAVLSGYMVYAMFLLNYYLSRSFTSNLTFVSIPAVVLSSAIVSHKTKAVTREYSFIRTFIIIVLSGLAIGSAYFTLKRLQQRAHTYQIVQTAKKYYGNRGFVLVNYAEQEGFTVNDLMNSVAEIKKLSPDSKKILLFSKYDVVILVMAEKTHTIPYPMLEQIYTVKELNAMKKYLTHLEIKPRYMFVDTKNPLYPPPTSFDNARELFETLKPFYTFDKKVGILDEYKLKEN